MVALSHAKVELAANSQYLQVKGLPRGRPWRKGQSGNPAGRRSGSRNSTTEFSAAFLNAGPEGKRTAVARAQAGDRVALKVLIELIMPKLRDRCDYPIPRVTTPAEAARVFADLAAAAAAGEISPDEAAQLSRRVARDLEISARPCDNAFAFAV